MLGRANASLHGTGVTIRERYSSCRLTGHDFQILVQVTLETQTIALYVQGQTAPNDTVQANEVVEPKRRKSIHTSTDPRW